MKMIDLTGQKFSKLTVVSRAIGNSRVKWDCLCECGSLAKVTSDNLQSGNTKSCGCLIPDVANGWNGTPEYTAFRNAKNRCERKSDVRFASYGGRGIKFLFQNMNQFIASIGPRPDGYSLDRIDPDGHYESGNVRWADLSTQARNKTTSRMVEIDGVTRNLKDWCEIYGQSYKRVWERIKDGSDAKSALTKPVGPTSRRKVWGVVEQTVIIVEAI